MHLVLDDYFPSKNWNALVAIQFDQAKNRKRRFLSDTIFLFQPKSQRALIEEAEHVDEDLESSRIAKEKFGFQRIISNNACREHCGVTDSLFEFKSLHNFETHSVWDDWKKKLDGVFSSALYEPKLAVYEPVDIAQIKPNLKKFAGV